MKHGTTRGDGSSEWTTPSKFVHDIDRLVYVCFARLSGARQP